MLLTRFTLAVLFALLLAATSGCQPAGQRNAMPASTQGLENPARNGARIYFTGASERASVISSSGGQNIGGGMMDGYGQVADLRDVPWPGGSWWHPQDAHAVDGGARHPVRGDERHAGTRRASSYLSPHLCSQRLYSFLQMGLDDAIALGVERDRADGRPVACFA